MTYKNDEITSKLFSLLGLNENSEKVILNPELTNQKMAMIGISEMMLQLIEAMKKTVSTSVTVNSNSIKVLLNSIDYYVAMFDKSLLSYDNTLKELNLKSTTETKEKSLDVENFVNQLLKTKPPGNSSGGNTN